MSKPDSAVNTGLHTLDDGQLQILRALDDALRCSAQAEGAREFGYPPLASVDMLERIDYFRNFPHLGLAVAPLNPDALAARKASAPAVAAAAGLQAEDLVAPRYLLPSAACYPVYAQLQDQHLSAAHRVTTVQRCFRNEDHFKGLARLLAFTMREIVTVGTAEEVRDFLGRRRQWVARFALAAGLDLAVQAASDPFFEPDGERARMQSLFPVKEEFVFEGEVAVSSVNFHRNFFGQRWNIRGANGEAAFSGCVAFGLERWLHALTVRWHGDVDAILQAVAAARAQA